MALGPGRYDDQCTQVREVTEARGVVLVVIDGLLGSGFSCQVQAQEQLNLVKLLRTLADSIEADYGRLS